MEDSRNRKTEISTFSAALRLGGLILLLTFPASAQWIKQSVDTKASLRGLSVVNKKVIWASGTGGTVVRTIDGGKNWNVMTVPGAEKLDFRDIEAFDANTAYILSIGNGEDSRIYKTIDGGKAWKLTFKNSEKKAFFDALACSSKDVCYAMSDPVNGSFLLIGTLSGGMKWDLNSWTGLNAVEGEAAFAASGTCLILNRNRIFIVSGGARSSVYSARLLETSGKFTRVDAPIVSGSSGSGIFSIAMFGDQQGVIVGGNYEKPGEAKDNLAFTTDGGTTWRPGAGLTGYRSGVTYVDRKTLVAVGTNGTDLSRDGGETWKKIGNENLNAVAAKGDRAVWAVGPTGLVVRLKQ